MVELLVALVLFILATVEFKFKILSGSWSKLVGSAILFFAVLSVVFAMIVTVPAGHVGVPLLFGKVQPIALQEGFNIINPLYSVVKMDCRVQKHEGKYDAASQDMQNVHVIMALNFKLIPEKAPEVYQKIGLGYGNIIIDPAAQEVLKAVTALHNAGEILITRPQIKADVQARLTDWLSKYFVDLREVSLVNIGFDPDYERAILAKQVEEQNAEKKKYMLVQAQKDAEIAAAKAKGLGDAAKAQALGEAEALKIKGAAEANYNKVVSASLSPILIQQQYFNKWNGALPTFYFGDKATPLIQIPTSK